MQFYKRERVPLALIISIGLLGGTLTAHADGDKKDGGKKKPPIQIGKPIITKDPPKPPKKDG